MDEIDRFQAAEPDVSLTVILPEYVPSQWWQRFLHNQMALRIKAMLMMREGVIVTTVRMHVPAVSQLTPVAIEDLDSSPVLPLEQALG